MKSTKKALWLSCLSLLLCCSMLIGSTFAWFTDSATTGVNKIVSGNLDIAMYKGTVSNGSIDYSTEVNAATKLFNDEALWEPGYTEVAYLKVENKGSLALKYQLMLQVNNEIEGVSVLGNKIKLSEILKYDLVEIGETEFYADRAAAIAAATDSKNLAEETVVGTMSPQDTKYYALIVYMPDSVGNTANHNGIDVPSIKLGVNLVATQAESESDSFGNDYDAGLEYPKAPSVSSAPVTSEGGINEEMKISNTPNPDQLLSKGDVTVIIPQGSLASSATALSLVVNKGVSMPEGITIAEGQTGTTYEISLIDQNAAGVSANNEKTFTVRLNIGKGHDASNIKVYHYAEEISSVSYDPETGVVVFTTTSFSPFTVVHDKEKINITYMTDTGVEVGKLSYWPDADNSNVFSELKIYENFIAVEEFSDFVAAVSSGGGSSQQLPGLPYYYFGDSEPTKVSYGNETFFYEDAAFTKPAEMPTEPGNYTVYCKFANHFLDWMCFPNPKMIYPLDLGEVYEFTVKGSSLGCYMSFGFGTQTVKTNSWEIVAQIQDSNGEWVDLPKDAWITNAYEPKIDLTKFTKGETVTIRIIDLYVPVTDADGNIMYYSHAEEIPVNTVFKLTPQW